MNDSMVSKLPDADMQAAPQGIVASGPVGSRDCTADQYTAGVGA